MLTEDSTLSIFEKKFFNMVCSFKLTIPIGGMIQLCDLAVPVVSWKVLIHNFDANAVLSIYE